MGKLLTWLGFLYCPECERWMRRHHFYDHNMQQLLCFDCLRWARRVLVEHGFIIVEGS